MQFFGRDITRHFEQQRHRVVTDFGVDRLIKGLNKFGGCTMIGIIVFLCHLNTPITCVTNLPHQRHKGVKEFLDNTCNMLTEYIAMNATDGTVGFV